MKWAPIVSASQKPNTIFFKMSRCTSETCIGGVLSPKMAYRMQQCAISSAEMIRETLPDFPGELKLPTILHICK
jgi:hypothetical protein